MNKPVKVIEFEGVKLAFNEVASGAKITFLVNPADLEKAKSTGPIGSKYMVVLAEIDYDNPEETAKAVEQHKPGKRGDPVSTPKSYGERMVQRAGILAASKEFQKWVNHLTAERAEEADCAAFIRKRCAVMSRRDLAADTTAQMRFMQMESDFNQWAGRTAEQRG